MIHKCILDAKVAAVNNANRYASEIHTILSAFFEQYVGKKIQKANGDLIKSISDKLPEFVCTNSLHVYRVSSEYNLIFVVKTCESSVGNFVEDYLATYHETYMYIGEMYGGELKRIVEPVSYKHDHSADSVRQARLVYRRMQELADEAKGLLYSFGEYDT